MALIPLCSERRRTAVSELYASVLLLGVTLSLGSLVTVAAVGQFGLQSGSASAANGVSEATAGKLVSLVYAAVASGSGGCTGSYQGVAEGTSFSMVLFDYGSAKFSPVAIYVNSTQYVAPYPVLLPGGSASYSLTLAGCAHASGQTVLVTDQSGDEVELGT
jgi:FlaG/FlaF family flagellin (archaellin)